jgi:flagellar protein FlaG
MNVIPEVNNNIINQTKDFVSKNDKREIQPINVVDISELKIDITGPTGTLIDEIIESIDKNSANENKNFDLKEIEQAINEYLKVTETDIQIEIDKETNQPIFKIIRSGDKEVIKEIPSKEVLDLFKRIKNMIGALCDCSA